MTRAGVIAALVALMWPMAGQGQEIMHSAPVLKAPVVVQEAVPDPFAALKAPLPRARPEGLRLPAAPVGPVPLPPLSPMNPAHPMDRALVCMARNLYFESRGQSRKGQIAVGHVVLNRMRQRRYPNSVCGVVKQGGRKGPCQFSWFCDRHSNTPRDLKTYGRMLKLALDLLQGRVADPTNGANMFHNTAVRPRWARAAQPRGRIGSHFFYYLRGR